MHYITSNTVMCSKYAMVDFYPRFTTHAGFVFGFLADVEPPELVSKLLVLLHRGEGVELLGD